MRRDCRIILCCSGWIPQSYIHTLSFCGRIALDADRPCELVGLDAAAVAIEFCKLLSGGVRTLRSHVAKLKPLHHVRCRTEDAINTVGLEPLTWPTATVG